MASAESATETAAPGQVVRFRRRLWRVDELIGQEVLATPIDSADTEPRAGGRRMQTSSGNGLGRVEPRVGLEPTTCGLQN